MKKNKTIIIKQKTEKVYNKIASEYDKQHFGHFWVEEFDFYKNILKGNNIVDLGCGAGRDAAIFIDNGFNYTGIDISSGMLKVANKRAPEGNFKQMDFSKTSFGNNTFDGFWASASFVHVPKNEIDKTLQEAKRITKKGGIGFISMKEKNKIEEGFIKKEKYGGISRYFSFYTQNEFKNTIEKNGFSVIKMAIYEENDKSKTKWLCYFVEA